MNYLMTRNNAMSDFENFFDDMFGNWGVRNSSIPTVDVLEDSKAYYLEAELAGYSEKDVKVDLDNHVLHISSEKKTNVSENRKFLVRERNYVKFDRSFTLPENINEGAIDAQFKDGILTITLPKVPKEEPKHISINFKH